MRDVAQVLVTGVACGLLAATFMGKMLQNQILGVQRFDALTLIAVSVFLFAAGLIAAWRPAFRAAKRSPMTILRDS
jgi:ABC-type antimicrobial peptide transport system permease subunit